MANTILVPSGAPKSLRANSVTSTRAELLWSEIDCELRHGRILGYNYELESLGPWGSNKTQQTTTHRVSLDSLAPYTQYRARVQGRNSKGVGPFTDWLTFQTLPAGMGIQHEFLALPMIFSTSATNGSSRRAGSSTRT